MKDLNSIRFLSSEKYFAILDNAWNLWLALQQNLFTWYSNEKLKSMYIPNNFSQLLLLMMEPLIFTGKETFDIWKHLLSSCWN